MLKFGEIEITFDKEDLRLQVNDRRLDFQCDPHLGRLMHQLGISVEDCKTALNNFHFSRLIVESQEAKCPDEIAKELPKSFTLANGSIKTTKILCYIRENSVDWGLAIQPSTTKLLPHPLEAKGQLDVVHACGNHSCYGRDCLMLVTRSELQKALRAQGKERDYQKLAQMIKEARNAAQH